MKTEKWRNQKEKESDMILAKTVHNMSHSTRLAWPCLFCVLSPHKRTCNMLARELASFSSSVAYEIWLASTLLWVMHAVF